MGNSDLENLINNMPAVKSYLSRTWKERHAKGTPVAFTSLQWQFYRRPDKWHIDHHPYLKWKVGDDRGTPIIGVYDSNVRRATFCNFRYKPEWIAKHKKQAI